MNNAQGYAIGNIIVCCDQCNKGKGDRFSYQQWYKMTEPFRTGELTHE